MTAREIALRVLYRLEKENLYADRVLSDALRGSVLQQRDRALVTELVNGVLRWRRRIDWTLDRLLVRRTLSDLTPWIRNILRIGLYQLEFLNRIPAVAATHQSVDLAKRYGHRGTASLVNAVLRSALRNRREAAPSFPSVDQNPVVHIGLRYSHPDWMVRSWLERYGLEETMALCRANNRAPSLTVRVNTLRASLSQVREKLETEHIRTEEGRLMPGFLALRDAGNLTAIEAFRLGWFQVQDESAALAVELLSPEPGHEVIDLCAAPGGKTVHLANLMEDKGLLLAVDRYHSRLRQLVENCHRLGIQCVRPLVADGRDLRCSPVDRVLVDAPCSGLGVLARRADLRWKKTKEEVAQLAILQLELLRNAIGLLKRGGLLVYSTCTIEDQENEDVISQLLSERDDVVIEPATSLVPEAVITPRGMVRTFPHRHGVDGVFAVRLRKVESGVTT